MDRDLADFWNLLWELALGVAAHLLWAWYGGVKRGEIVLEDAA